MSDELDKELDAINSILKALDPLEADEKKRVIEYCLTRLGLRIATNENSNKKDSYYNFPPEFSPSEMEPPLEELRAARPAGAVTDIRKFREEKEPSTAIQMAAIVAFYLSELAPIEERKQTVSADDISKYFKQASFRLPGGVSGGAATLRNAKNSGYLDSTGEAGVYKLNPVGYNLVAFNLPKSSSQSMRVSRKPRAPKKQKKTKKS